MVGRRDGEGRGLKRKKEERSLKMQMKQRQQCDILTSDNNKTFLIPDIKCFVKS